MFRCNENPDGMVRYADKVSFLSESNSRASAANSCSSTTTADTGNNNR